MHMKGFDTDLKIDCKSNILLPENIVYEISQDSNILQTCHLPDRVQYVQVLTDISSSVCLSHSDSSWVPALNNKYTS